MKLVYKINFAVLILLVVSSLLVGSFFTGSFRDLRNETYSWFDESARQLAMTIGNKAKEAIGYFDYESVERDIEAHIADDPNLLYVSVAFDKDLSDSRETGTPGTESFRPFEVELKDGEETVLKVTIHYSTAVLDKKLGALLWRITVGSGVTLVVLLVLLYLLVSSLVSRPLNRIVDYATVAAGGDLTASIDVETSDEFGTLAGTLNRMTANLRDMIEKVHRAFGDLEKLSIDITGASHSIADGSAGQTRAVETVTSSIEEMNSSIKSVVQMSEKLYALAGESSSSMLEMSASVEQVTGNTEGLSTTVTTTSSHLEKMSRSIRTVADNISRLAELVTNASSSINEIEATVGEIESNSEQSYQRSLETARTMTEEGMDALRKTSEGMHEISQSVGSASEVARTLEQRSRDIGSILNVINDVNDQTNLLALNAAIIAAQAGEHGKGFAVVADEIRELSARTASSTDEISKIISRVQQESKNAVLAMDDGKKRVEVGVKAVEGLDAALQKAALNSEEASAASRGIVQSTKEQFKAIRHISSSIQTVNEMAQEIAGATRDQSADTTEIMKSAGNMSDLAEQTNLSSAEQAKGIRMTSKASEESALLAQRVLEATREEASGSELVVQSIGSIQDITKKNEGIVKRLDEMVNVLAEQAGLLKKEIGRFKIDG